MSRPFCDPNDRYSYEDWMNDMATKGAGRRTDTMNDPTRAGAIAARLANITDALREYADLQDMVAASGGTFPVRLNGAYLSETLRNLADELPALLSGGAESFQDRVSAWMLECFTESIADDIQERGDRLIEEALELVQAHGYDRNRVAALTDYVFNRPAGEPTQEVGGVMVTLAAYCRAAKINMHDAGETELARILRPEIIAKIRAKQAAKPTGSALPIAAPPASAAREAEVLAMVDRFLAWRFPEDFAPDGGISYTPLPRLPEWTHDTRPTGTNLLTAIQARAMLEYVLAAQGGSDK